MIIFRFFLLLTLIWSAAIAVAAPLGTASSDGPVIVYSDDFGRISTNSVDNSLQMEAAPGTRVLHIRVSSAAGNTVLDLTEPALPYDWDTSALPEGTYIIWVTTEVQTYSVTFVVEH